MGKRNVQNVHIYILVLYFIYIWMHIYSRCFICKHKKVVKIKIFNPIHGKKHISMYENAYFKKL